MNLLDPNHPLSPWWRPVVTTPEQVRLMNRLQFIKVVGLSLILGGILYYHWFVN